VKKFRNKKISFFSREKRAAGFSLIEVMVVVALLALFAAAIGPVYNTVQSKNNLDVATAGVVQSLRRAQSSAESGNADSNWGVKLSATSTIVFAGNPYASRQASFDEKLDLPGAVTVSGLLEIVFNKFSGLPQSTGTTTITNPFGSKNIILNGAGTISY
jgi:prepilin-type N-terminal cleavage/methylation domain-containing protein